MHFFNNISSFIKEISRQLPEFDYSSIILSPNLILKDPISENNEQYYGYWYFLLQTTLQEY